LHPAARIFFSLHPLRLWRIGICPPLLKHMGKLMPQKVFPMGGEGGILPLSERDVVSKRKGFGIQGVSQLGGLGIRMQAYLAEIFAEAGLKEGAGRGIQRGTAMVE